MPEMQDKSTPVKNLLDFHESEAVQSPTSTHVEAIDFYKTPVYLATEQAFKNYCLNCPRLVRKEDIKSDAWKHRVICSVPRCEK